MFLYCLFWLLGAGSALTVLLTRPSLSWWWLLPMTVGFAAALSLFYVLVLMAVSLFLPREEGRPHSRICRFIVLHTVAWFLVILGYRIDAEGLDRLPTDRPFLLVGNHRSNLDPMVEMVALRRFALAFISKPENFRIPIVGPFIHAASYLALDRDNPRNAVTTIHRAAEYIRERGLSIGIYPEGTRSKTGELLEFHHGSFKIAKLAACPIAVMTVEYGKRRFGFIRVRLRVPAVLDETYVAENRTNAISDRVREIIEEALAG